MRSILISMSYACSSHTTVTVGQCDDMPYQLVGHSLSLATLA